VSRDDVDPFFPYISSDGAKTPESCFFGLFMNLSAIISLIIVFLRHRLVAELNRGADKILKNLNFMSVLVSVVAFVGMLGVANFQETAILVVHMTSAFMCFGCACAYFVMQAAVTFRMYPLYNGRRICYIRAFIAFASVASFATSVLFGTLASVEFHRQCPGKATPRPWSRKTYEPGYDLHVISAIAEWVLVACNAAFLLSYSRDFEKIRVDVGVQPLVTHLDESPILQSLQDSISGAPII